MLSFHSCIKQCIGLHYVDVYAAVHSALTVNIVEIFKETLCLVGEMVSGRSNWCCSVRPDKSYILYLLSFYHVVMIDA